MGYIIFVNATAARSGGSLSILRQFLQARQAFDQTNKYYVFCGQSDLIASDANIQFVRIDTSRWIDRLMWDYFGCARWASSSSLKPDIIISFQNTGIRFPGRPQIIYYHQPLPLFAHRWKFYKQGEIVLFLYRHFYPVFVKSSINRQCTFVVQLDSIKGSFCRTFGIAGDRVRVLRPSVPNISLSDVIGAPLEDQKLHFIYPAMAAPYKNHAVVLRALWRIRAESRELFSTLRFHFTLDQVSGNDVMQLAKSLGVVEAICLHGSLSFQEVLSLYKSSDALVFPSFIETFGLPLVEAAAFGLPILAADLPYSREVLQRYGGVCFLPYDREKAWAEAISQVQKGVRFDPLLPPREDPWKNFFQLINEILASTSRQRL